MKTQGGFLKSLSDIFLSKKKENNISKEHKDQETNFFYEVQVKKILWESFNKNSAEIYRRAFFPMLGIEDYLNYEGTDADLPDDFLVSQIVSNKEYNYGLTNDIYKAYPHFKNTDGFFIFKDIKISVPVALKFLVDIVEKSKKILDLKDDWDEEGSKGYRFSTWKSAVVFVLEYAKTIYTKMDLLIDKPNIYPGPNGSIDIDWETERYGLLMNVAEGGEVVTYYANYQSDQSTEGRFNPNKYNIFLLPLAVNT